MLNGGGGDDYGRYDEDEEAMRGMHSTVTSKRKCSHCNRTAERQGVTWRVGGDSAGRGARRHLLKVVYDVAVHVAGRQHEAAGLQLLQHGFAE